ncbi:MAG: hypothetical protein GF384_04465, partial [Elusimicrobia bacterium]|nr:hypothetical protein [Elusimicrobiota bacterium]MBD3412102.1 hypothetical protein [Elusimicrobiota bacterium]
TIVLSEYKNPLLSEKKNIEPLSIQFGKNFTALLLSGPNMGGKTTTARGIGLAVLLTQMGFPLPSPAVISPFKNIYTVFPEPEQLREGYGYFGSLIEQLSELLKKAGPGDLVILDEVPIGTDYTELVSIATVIIEDLIASGAVVIVTGHLKKAFELVAQRTGIQPFMHTTTEKKGIRVPDFKLAPGVAKHSHAIELMLQAGFPHSVVELARQYYTLITRQQGFTSMPELSDNHTRATYPQQGFHDDEVPDSDEIMVEIVAQNLFPEKNFAFTDFDHNTRSRIIQGITSSHEPALFDFDGQQDIKELIRKDIEEAEESIEPDDPVQQTEKKEYFERINDNLSLIAHFIKQGKPYLDQLTNQLARFKNITSAGTVKSTWVFAPHKEEINTEKNEKALNDIEKYINGFLEFIEPLQGQESIDRLVPFFNQRLELIPELRQKYVLADVAVMNNEEKEEFQSEWKYEWAKLYGYISEILMFFDQYTGVAKTFIEHDLKPPVFVDTPNTLSLENSRPLFPRRELLLALPSSPFIREPVPQSFGIDPANPIMAITGPNSSGKSVLLFNARMNALLALKGLYVSGDLTMSRFVHVQGFFGGQDAVGKGESYFLNIISRYARILYGIEPNSLVILDELHGTDNFELAAIQLAILHYLRTKNVTVIFNTHIRDGLKELADHIGIDLWKTDVKYDPRQNNIKPKYTVSRDPKLSAKSHGLVIAQQWLSPDQIKRAAEIYDYQMEHNIHTRPLNDAEQSKFSTQLKKSN